MNYWLMKSEPSTFSIDDLKNQPKQTMHWDGVRNYQARNIMRDEMKLNDLVLFYHSSCPVPGIVGIAKVVKNAYPDHTQFDPESKYYDPKSTSENPRWWMVDVKFVQKFSDIIGLEQLKQIDELHGMQVLKRGNRLSITPVTKSQWEIILQLVGKKE